MVESASDIIQGVAHLRGAAMQEPTPPTYATQQAGAPSDDELSEARSHIIQKLSVMAVAVDELIEQCDTTASVVLTVLLELELAGHLRRNAGNKVALVADFSENVA